MGCVAATAKRRRRQAVMGYRHLAKKQRPRYRKRSEDKLNRKARRQADQMKVMMERKGKNAVAR